MQPRNATGEPLHSTSRALALETRRQREAGSLVFAIVTPPSAGANFCLTEAMSDATESVVHDLAGLMAAFDPKTLQQQLHTGEPLLEFG